MIYLSRVTPDFYWHNQVLVYGRLPSALLSTVFTCLNLRASTKVLALSRAALLSRIVFPFLFFFSSRFVLHFSSFLIFRLSLICYKTVDEILLLVLMKKNL